MCVCVCAQEKRENRSGGDGGDDWLECSGGESYGSRSDR